MRGNVKELCYPFGTVHVSGFAFVSQRLLAFEAIENPMNALTRFMMQEWPLD